MPDLNNTEQLRKWFRGCPVLQPENRFGVDYLNDEATEYAIYSTPSTILYRENVLGEEVPRDVQTLNYIFASKEFYGSDVEQNLENLGFYQAVMDWILEQNSARNFPEINEGEVKSIVPTLSPYVVSADADAARYQIQIKLVYKRK